MKLNVTNIAREMARMSSSDLRELETALMQNGISATIYRFSPTNSVWDEKNEYPHPVGYHPGYEKENYYKVILEWVPKNKKLQAVKTIKELLGLGLKEAKELTDNTPKTLKEYSPRMEVEKLRDSLEAIGCDVEIIKVLS